MPMYVYNCSTCGKCEHRIVKLSERDAQTCACAEDPNKQCALVREEISQTSAMGMNWADWKGAG